MAKWAMTMVWAMGAMLLGGCMAVRAPVLAATVADAGLIPKGGKIVAMEVQPILWVFPLDRAGATGAPRAVVRVRVPASPEEVLRLYRAGLAKRGWREEAHGKKEPPAVPGGRYVFSRADQKQIGGPWPQLGQEISVELWGKEGETLEVQLTLEGYQVMDCPGLAIGGLNYGVALVTAEGLHSSAAAWVMAIPLAVVVGVLF